MNRQLLLIDCQFDFVNPQGSLFVNGADKDMDRITEFVLRTSEKFDLIHATLDQHRTYSIFFTNFWLDTNGVSPNVFTTIKAEDVEKGTWRTKNPQHLETAKRYVTELQKRGKYPLCLWPRHCTCGSVGGTIDKCVFEALSKYENDCGKRVNYFSKGTSQFSENYGCFEAEIPELQDSYGGSQISEFQFSCDISKAKEIYVAGEALSHCVATSIRQIDKFVDISKVTLLSDCCSNVTGFEKLGQDFIEEFVAKGMKLQRSTDIEF